MTAESLATRRARTPLEREFGLGRGTLHAQAYWIKGRAMGKSRVLAEASQQQPAVTEATVQDSPAPERVLAPARTALILGGIAQGLVSLVNIVPFLLFAEVARLFLRGADLAEFIAQGLLALVVMGVSAGGTTALLLGMHLHDARFAAALRRALPLCRDRDHGRRDGFDPLPVLGHPRHEAEHRVGSSPFPVGLLDAPQEGPELVTPGADGFADEALLPLVPIT